MLLMLLLLASIMGCALVCVGQCRGFMVILRSSENRKQQQQSMVAKICISQVQMFECLFRGP
jgi:hypothetical protein